MNKNLVMLIMIIALIAVLVPIVKKNEKTELKNSDLKAEIESLEHDMRYTELSLEECNNERFEFRKYFGGLDGLMNAREYYNAPATN